ncbi:hypothetical protein [Burkholderia sp. BCC0322]|uniref:hypothetical protein n=1 Tax=unclassified Burkholderia TaxID=2613784 RepID=UPI00158B4248|nr:hypothetical protein [Burkholderia sp. BCC0322]
MDDRDAIPGRNVVRDSNGCDGDGYVAAAGRSAPPPHQALPNLRAMPGSARSQAGPHRLIRKSDRPKKQLQSND